MIMVKMVSIEGLHCPCAFCDFCGLRIENEGILVWNYEAPEDLKMIHKGECDRKHNLKHGEYNLWQDLAKYSEHFTYNISR